VSQKHSPDCQTGGGRRTGVPGGVNKEQMNSYGQGGGTSGVTQRNEEKKRNVANWKGLKNRWGSMTVNTGRKKKSSGPYQAWKHDTPGNPQGVRAGQRKRHQKWEGLRAEIPLPNLKCREKCKDGVRTVWWPYGSVVVIETGVRGGGGP